MNVRASDVNWDQLTEVNEYSMWWSISPTEQHFNEYTGQQLSCKIYISTVKNLPRYNV